MITGGKVYIFLTRRRCKEDSVCSLCTDHVAVQYLTCNGVPYNRAITKKKVCDVVKYKLISSELTEERTFVRDKL